jgi:predicted N-formylglutamate amidohydrolase
MIEEEKRNQKKVQAWVPMQLWEEVSALGYKNTTEAVIKGFEKLLVDTNRNPNESTEIHEARARIEGLEVLNDTLKRDLNQARQDKDDLKKTFDNYMVQVQTLINQKAVEAPGTKKPWWRFW